MTAPAHTNNAHPAWSRPAGPRGRTFRAEIDTGTPLTCANQGGHNRWLPDLQPYIQCDSYDTVRIPTWDALNGQLSATSTADDVANMDTSVAHPISGPIGVRGAQPGDLLEVRIVSITPGGFGYTAFSPNFGFLRHEIDSCAFFPWKLHEGYATCPTIPGVRIPNASFLGIIGLAPSATDYSWWRDRERHAHDGGQFADDPELAAGAVPAAAADDGSGLRTGPPRESGGNLDVRQLGEGARLFLPVRTPGALLSVGDAHFAQGDGEVCGQAIEMSATVELQLVLHKRTATHPDTALAYRYRPGRDAHGTGDYLATIGLSIDEDGRSSSENVTAASRNALLALIGLLEQRGYTRDQAYALCSVAADLRISQIVDVPHVIVSARIPLGIFTRHAGTAETHGR